jgi:hypothetical protein
MDQFIERIQMNSDNVIKFPVKNSPVKTKDDRINEDAQNFSLEIVEVLHDHIHSITGLCIYDDELSGYTACLAELIAAMYLQMNGVEHPIIKDSIDEFFSVDISDDEIYNDLNDIDKD